MNLVNGLVALLSVIIIIIIIIIIAFIYSAQIQLYSFQMRLTIKDQKI